MQKRAVAVDIAIVGGGLVGNSMACSLLPSLAAAYNSSTLKNLRIALIDPVKPSARNPLQPQEDSDSTIAPPYSNRVSALTPTSVQLLQAPTGGQHMMGVIAENSEINAALLKRLFEHHHRQQETSTDTSNSGNLLMLHGASVREIQWPAEYSNPVRLTVSEGGPDGDIEMEANLVIGADGAQSFVRRSVVHEPIDFNGWDYNQHGVVGTVHVTNSNSNSNSNNNSKNENGKSMTSPACWQRFLPTGPVALLPLPSCDYSVYSLVWSCPPSMAKQLCSVPADSFCHLLNTALHCDPVELEYMLTALAGGDQSIDLAKEYRWRRSVIGAHSLNADHHHHHSTDNDSRQSRLPPEICSIQPDSRASFPLRFRHASCYIDNRLALIGDAAHQIHPMAGQGLNLGLGDVKCLGRVVEAAVRSGRDIGDLNVLREYNRERMLKNGAMMTAIDSLWRLFDGGNPLPGSLTAWGMSALNGSPLVKSALMRAAMTSSFL